MVPTVGFDYIKEKKERQICCFVPFRLTCAWPSYLIHVSTTLWEEVKSHIYLYDTFKTIELTKALYIKSILPQENYTEIQKKLKAIHNIKGQ